MCSWTNSKYDHASDIGSTNVMLYSLRLCVCVKLNCFGHNYIINKFSILKKLEFIWLNIVLYSNRFVITKF